MSEERLSSPVFTIKKLAPEGDEITDYDREHFLTYARLLDAERAGLDWKVAATKILLCDVTADPENTHRCWEMHLARAHWIVSGGNASRLSS